MCIRDSIFINQQHVVKAPPNIAVQVTASLALSGRVRSSRDRGEKLQQTRQRAAPDGWVVGRPCRRIVRICDEKRQRMCGVGETSPRVTRCYVRRSLGIWFDG